MPIEFNIDHSAKRVVARAYGAVSLPDVLAYFDAILVEGASRYPKLFDAREANFELSDDDMMVVGARASLYASFLPGPAAFVLDPTTNATSNAAVFVRRYQNLAKAGREVELFDSRDRAEQWLWNAGSRED